MKAHNKILSLLETKQKREAIALLSLSIVMSFFEVVGIASLFPFMSVLAAPETIQTNSFLKWGYDTFGFQSSNAYLFVVGAIALFLLLLANGVKAFTRWSLLVATQRWGKEISCRMLNTYLRQPYSFFLHRNSSDISKNVLSEVLAITNNVTLPAMDMVTQGIVALVICAYLAYTDVLLSFIVMFSIGGIYLFLTLMFKKKLRYHAALRAKAQTEKYRIVNEAIQGIKNIKLVGYEGLYSDYFKAPSQIFSNSTAKASVIAELPKYALEVIAFGSMLFIMLYLLKTKAEGLENILPVMAVYAFAAYRLMPCVQSLYNSYTKIRFNLPVIDLLSKELSLENSMQPVTDAVSEPLPFKQSLKAQNISYAYANSARNIFDNLNVEIPAQSMVGIIGKTGAGKTTFVDLLLGLLEPEKGHVLVDGTQIDSDNRALWQKNLSYVSQHIYLSDDTIESNIAFGVGKSLVDADKVRAAAKMASLSDFIEKDLPDSYQTIVGENGIRLSGGQRQRIGLARALYLGRPVIVLDEATSALDPETEADVMDSIHNMDQKKTILIISHKLELLRQCDFVLVVEDGKVTKKSYDEILHNYDYDDREEFVKGPARAEGMGG